MHHGMSSTLTRLRPLDAFLVTRRTCLRQCRSFTISPPFSSGHNRWSKIRHDKGANDAAKSKERSGLSKDITNAVKQYGADPAFNPSLTHFLNLAKRTNLPKTVIQNAILKGQGKSASGAALEPVIIEAMLPGQVSAIIDCLTDNKARTLQHVRTVLGKFGSTTGSGAMFCFEKKGRVTFAEKDGVDIDTILEPAIEAGATDVSIDDEEADENRIRVDTAPSDVQSVAKSLSEKMGLQVVSAEIIYDAKEEMMVDIGAGEGEGDSEAAEKIEKILALVREETGVQEIYLNAK